MSRLLVVAIGLLASAITFSARTAHAATWTGGRTTPSLREIVAIDATGESTWIYGQEDVAGDTLTAFTLQEQAIDFRTAYAAADASTFWVRAYASHPNEVGANVTLFVFIDSDANTATGGKASASEINALLTTDPSPGGYDSVIVVRGNGAVDGLWQWRSAQSRFVLLASNQGTRAGEIGTDIDPILINPNIHGYVQAAISASTLGLTPACGATLFFRSINTTQGLGNGDLDIGKAGACVPPDANGDDVPDVVAPPAGCSDDPQCPEHGVCVDGACVLVAPCVTSADCPAGRTCTADGRCVLQGGTSCTTSDTCDGLVCVSGKCTACTPGGSECGDGRCGPDGRCVGGGGGAGGGTGDGGIALAAGDKVVGGAFHCSTRGSAGGAEVASFAIFGAAALSLASRRRRRRERGQGDSETKRPS